MLTSLFGRPVRAWLMILGLGSMVLSGVARADSPVTGKWVCNKPGLSMYFHFFTEDSGAGNGGVAGTFHHGEIINGFYQVRSRGRYVIRPIGPNRAALSLYFDEGAVYNLEDDLGDNTMYIQHGGGEFWSKVNF